MAHYLNIHSIDKEVVRGIPVIAFTDNSPFDDKMTLILEIVRCEFNNVFRRHFNVNSEWDCNYFVIKAGYIRYLIDDLKRELTKGEDGEIYDFVKFHQVMSCLEDLSKHSDPDATYLLSWEK